MAGCQKREGDREGSQYLFYSASALPHFSFFGNAPWVLFERVTWQQTHHFVFIFSLQAETSHRGSSGEASQRPTWLTYQWRARHILWACSVTHNWSWQQSLLLPTARKEQKLLGLRDMETLQYRALSVCLFVGVLLPLSLYFSFKRPKTHIDFHKLSAKPTVFKAMSLMLGV